MGELPITYGVVGPTVTDYNSNGRDMGRRDFLKGIGVASVAGSLAYYDPKIIRNGLEGLTNFLLSSISKIRERLSEASVGNAYAQTEADAAVNFSDLDGRVDTSTDWTPEQFIREIAEADRTTYVHWRWEGIGDNVSGDGFIRNLVSDFPEIDRIVIIELSKYKRQDLKKLIKIPLSYNREEGPIDGAPCGSLFKNGDEFRIRGPPSKTFPYVKMMADMKSWINGNYNNK